MRPIEDRVKRLERLLYCCNSVKFYDDTESFPEEGKRDILYIDKSDGQGYIWDGSDYKTSLSTVDEFLELLDTPDDYSGEGGKLLSVKTSEDGIEFIDLSSIDISSFNIDLDTDDVPEGSNNLYYTEQRVNNNTNVSANTSARHTHSNKTLLDSLTSTGNGNKFLSDDGTYIDIFAGTVGFVIHASDDTTVRPSNYGIVVWIGDVQPLNAGENDIWIDNGI